MARKPKAAAPAPSRVKAAQNRRKPRPEPKPPLAARAELALSKVGLDRPGRERAQAYLVRAAVAVTAVALLVAVLALLERHVKTSKSFAIEQVEITGNEQLTNAQVLRAAGLALGQNVFAVGPEQARANLLREPWIEAADVRRRLPGRFSINLRERHAVALLASGQLQLVSDEGVVF
ncbi:MAG TPA: FtsQ-type POTRA domain-containing protein, partial [Polyangiales bacterium]|nr:FtsQ-type POTRA domain-containing protein [Polyangiales bacterium]